MLHPFQAICSAIVGEKQKEYLFAACGPTIYVCDATNDQKDDIRYQNVFEWTSAEISTSNGHDVNEELEQPAKKRKIEPKSLPALSVIKLVVSPDQTHLVAVTGDDKCIRVFQIEDSGKLIQLSQRCMPKRPCALLITNDNQSILCGDKFGDVYSIPLIQEAAEEVTQETAVATKKEKTYTPSATNLTVHTARNRKALEEQMRIKGAGAASTREPLKFRHELLLGHVSMLTDMQLAKTEVDGMDRMYLITADRDEHIRVSRGPPQAYIIEGFCQGHTEFISHIHALHDPSRGLDILVSGGGNDWLGVWDWKTSKLMARHDMRAAVADIWPDEKPIAVSRMWAIPRRNGDGDQSAVLVVALEGLLRILLFPAEELGESTCSSSTWDSTAPMIDMIAMSDGHIVAAIDAEDSEQRLVPLKLSDPKPAIVAAESGVLRNINKCGVAADNRAALDSLLYGVERLRKRGGDDDMDGT